MDSLAPWKSLVRQRLSRLLSESLGINRQAAKGIGELLPWELPLRQRPRPLSLFPQPLPIPCRLLQGVREGGRTFWSDRESAVVFLDQVRQPAGLVVEDGEAGGEEVEELVGGGAVVEGGHIREDL